MQRPIFFVVILYVCLLTFAPSSQAQQTGPANDNRVSFLRAGAFYGRTGDALGISGNVEINPVWWLGFCAFASHSRATSVTEDGPVVDWDVAVGACATAHLPEVKGFLISPFVQMSYQSDHNRVDIPLGDGTTFRVQQDQMNHLWAVGTAIDRAIVKNGPRWAVRIGKNFGAGPAVENVGGLYAVGGVIFPLDHPVLLERSFRRMVGMKP
jgi:hypothetical protein